MSAPLETAEFKTLYVGNTSDDDGQVIDSLVQEVDSPAEKVMEPIDQEPLQNPKPINRLMTGTLVLNGTDTIAPQMILPPDDNRIHLRVDGLSLAVAPAAKDYAFLSDENGKVSGAGTLAFRLRHNKALTTDDYTGAVWVFPGPIVADNFEVTWVAVTS